MDQVGNQRLWGVTVGWATLAGLVAMLALLMPLARADGKVTPCEAGKPDLVISDADFRGRPYVFLAEKTNASVKDITRNRCSGRAGPSLTRAYIVHDSQRRRLADRALPGLPGGQENAGVSDDPGRTRHFPPGAYTVLVCADQTHDVPESDETNNCRSIPQLHFTSAARFWDGTVSGIYSFGSGDVRERWRSANAEFKFDQYLGGGTFAYDFVGDVRWTTSGTDAGGCTWNGTGTRSFNPAGGGLTFDYVNGEYIGGTTNGRFYRIAVKCPGAPVGYNKGPFWGSFWNTGGKPYPFEFGDLKLAGSRAHPYVPALIWSWDLEATVAD